MQASFVGPRLSVMMFLQFFIWGAWFVTAPRYLSQVGFGAADFAWTYSVGPLSAFIAPLFVGMIADRFFPSERVLGVMHLAGGGLMLLAASMMDPANPANPNLINVIIFGHTLCYYPTLALTNSLAMHNLTDSEKQFPLIRVFGTIGWIVAGTTLAYLGWGDRIEMFHLAAGAAIVLGLYSFTLPHTPPPAKGKKVKIGELLGADAFVLFKRRSFTVFVVCSFLICIPLAFYYQLAERAVAAAGVGNTPFVMTWGQWSEIGFMVLMPLFFARLGVKWMLAVGMFAWIARYALFSVGAPSEIQWMMMVGVVLHGICYDFFFVTGQIYTNEIAAPEIRGQAQGLLAALTIGLGMLIGAQTAGYSEGVNTPPASVELNAEAGELAARVSALESSGGGAAEIEKLDAERAETALQALQEMNWRSIWLPPALGAALVLAFFLLLFKDDRKSAGG